MADNKGQGTKKPTDSQKKLQESQAQVDEVSVNYQYNLCYMIYLKYRYLLYYI